MNKFTFRVPDLRPVLNFTYASSSYARVNTIPQSNDSRKITRRCTTQFLWQQLADRVAVKNHQKTDENNNNTSATAAWSMFLWLARLVFGFQVSIKHTVTFPPRSRIIFWNIPQYLRNAFRPEYLRKLFTIGTICLRNPFSIIIVRLIKLSARRVYVCESLCRWRLLHDNCHTFSRFEHYFSSPSFMINGNR